MTKTKSPNLVVQTPIQNQGNPKCIALIDDAFDIPEPSDDQISDFLATVNNRRNRESVNKRQEFENYCNTNFQKTLQSFDDLNDKDILNKIWEDRSVFVFLRDDIQQLFGLSVSKLAQIQRIKSKIEEVATSTNNTLEIKELGSDVASKIEELRNVDIILIDYRMGPEGTEREKKNSTAKAVEIVKLIDKELAPNLPLVILISSDPNVISNQDDFQKRSQWLKGLFYCIPKADLENDVKLKINYSSWHQRLKGGKAINDFAKTLENSLENSVNLIKEKLNQLSLEDYAFINHYSLQADGQALGEYILWLLGAYTKQEIFEENKEVTEKRDLLDKIKFDEIPLKKLMPTDALIDMYDSALFDKNSKLEKVSLIIDKPEYEQAVASTNKIKIRKPSNPQAKEVEFVNLKPGLVFVNDIKEPSALMVINADCDLVVTKNGKRTQNQPIVFIKGVLTKINQSKMSANEYDTEFFRYKDCAYHISWDVKSTIFCQPCKVLSYLKKHKYKLEGRLRIPFISKVQQAYSNQFSRIGLPVSPPINYNVKAEVYYVNSDSRVERLAESKTDVAFFSKVRREEDNKKVFQCHFTDEFYYFLHDSINLVKSKYETEISDLGSRLGEDSGNDGLVSKITEKISIINNKKTQIKNLSDNYFDWINKKKTHSFSENNKADNYNFLDENGLVKIFWEDHPLPKQGNENEIVFINFI